MAVATPEQFKTSIKARGPMKVYMNGRRITNLWDHPVTRTVLEANLASYEWANTPEGEPVLTTHSHLINEKIHRYTHVCRSIEDLEAKAAAGTWVAERLGTCIYRCVGLDACHSLAATTWEMDQKEGTDYYARFTEYLKYIQKNDLSVAGALTEARGDRKQRSQEWKNPYLSVKLVEKKPDGIVVRGAKINISGAYGGHEVIVLPQSAKREGEEDYALAFALPADTEGLIYICQYNPLSAEREQCESPDELGNPRFGQRETSIIVLDDVFVPWERVFLCGETPYSGKMVARFAQTHRMTCGGTCKVGFMNQVIGAAKWLQEMKGMEKVPHINDQLVEMVTLRETVRACGLAAAFKGQEIPPGSGVYMPNDMFGNIAKLNVAPAFWRVMALAGDIAGGLPVTMPSIRELRSPETAEYVNEFLSFGSEYPAEAIMKVTKLIQNWTAGLHGVGTWHGAGPVAAQKIMINRLSDFEHDKEMVSQVLKLDEILNK
ncbi:MAG: 4-hydroxyphenylacetate 3-hydroxylase N-terminal domain-containing protein [Pseudomonadota bacterium]